jgi:hypothetical protein
MRAAPCRANGTSFFQSVAEFSSQAGIDGSTSRSASLLSTAQRAKATAQLGKPRVVLALKLFGFVGALFSPKLDEDAG